MLELNRALELSQTTNSLDWMKGGSGGVAPTNFNATAKSIIPVVGIIIILFLLFR